ncbi:mitochondrial carrier domain-containing protein [Mycena leptocephala]|nr:mitochondrial carrier domain-containing protein [Mycena leptocephala]
MAETPPVKDTLPEEQAPEASEAQPLLPRHESDLPEAPVKRNPWEVGVYVALSVIGAVLLGFFIKGFIDAGDVDFDFKKAFKSALGGGLSGAAAMVIQVLTLMPLRTVMNYQYRYGTSTSQAIRTLYEDGGWTRYYQGMSAALIQGPVSRFGDTFANAGIIALLDSNPYLKHMWSFVKTIFSSLAAAAFRMILTPIDTVKTTLQTQGKSGMRILRNRVKMYGIGSLWYGAFATAAATFAGHYPWFSTLNFLEANLPKANTLLEKLFRRAFIGFCASVTSDTVSNSLRVVKTYRQVNETRIGYFDAARAVIATDGLIGLFGRGLKTRIIANGLQGLMFTVLWKFFEDLWNEKTKT